MDVKLYLVETSGSTALFSLIYSRLLCVKTRFSEVSNFFSPTQASLSSHVKKIHGNTLAFSVHVIICTIVSWACSPQTLIKMTETATPAWCILLIRTCALGGITHIYLFGPPLAARNIATILTWVHEGKYYIIIQNLINT